MTIRTWQKYDTNRSRKRKKKKLVKKAELRLFGLHSLSSFLSIYFKPLL